MKLLIIDNYDSFTYNLVQLVEQAGISEYIIIKNDKLDDLDFNSFDRVIISPGPGIAKEAGQLMRFLHTISTYKSVLGICLGYEAIGELFGAKLTKLPEPLHGVQNIANVIEKDQIFSGLPTNFKIGHYHSWIISEKDMPKKFSILLKDENDLPMAIKHKEFDLTGLQFHPESIMTDYGLEMIKNWLNKTT